MFLGITVALKSKLSYSQIFFVYFMAENANKDIVYFKFSNTLKNANFMVKNA